MSLIIKKTQKVNARNNGLFHGVLWTSILLSLLFQRFKADCAAQYSSINSVHGYVDD